MKKTKVRGWCTRCCLFYDRGLLSCPTCAAREMGEHALIRGFVLALAEVRRALGPGDEGTYGRILHAAGIDLRLCRKAECAETDVAQLRKALREKAGGR